MPSPYTGLRICVEQRMQIGETKWWINVSGSILRSPGSVSLWNNQRPLGPMSCPPCSRNPLEAQTKRIEDLRSHRRMCSELREICIEVLLFWLCPFRLSNYHRFTFTRSSSMHAKVQVVHISDFKLDNLSPKYQRVPKPLWTNVNSC
jgi:hypothetical protein